MFFFHLIIPVDKCLYLFVHIQGVWVKAAKRADWFHEWHHSKGERENSRAWTESQTLQLWTVQTRGPGMIFLLLLWVSNLSSVVLLCHFLCKLPLQTDCPLIKTINHLFWADIKYSIFRLHWIYCIFSLPNLVHPVPE